MIEAYKEILADVTDSALVQELKRRAAHTPERKKTNYPFDVEAIPLGSTPISRKGAMAFSPASPHRRKSPHKVARHQKAATNQIENNNNPATTGKSPPATESKKDTSASSDPIKYLQAPESNAPEAIIVKAIAPSEGTRPGYYSHDSTRSRDLQSSSPRPVAGAKALLYPQRKPTRRHRGTKTSCIDNASTKTICIDTAKEILMDRTSPSLKVFEPSPRRNDASEYRTPHGNGNNNKLQIRRRNSMKERPGGVGGGGVRGVVKLPHNDKNNNNQVEPRQHLSKISIQDLEEWLDFAKHKIHDASQSTIDCTSTISSMDLADVLDINQTPETVEGPTEAVVVVTEENNYSVENDEQEVSQTANAYPFCASFLSWMSIAKTTTTTKIELKADPK